MRKIDRKRGWETGRDTEIDRGRVRARERERDQKRKRGGGMRKRDE